MILCQFGTKNKKVSKTNPLFTNLIVAIIEKNLILTPSPPQTLMVLMFGTPPSQLLLKEGGRTFRKFSHLEGTKNFAKKRE